MADNFPYLKQKVIDRFPEVTYKFISAYYPDWKQKSDNVDIIFWSAWILNKSVDDWTKSKMEKTIYEKVAEYFDGSKTFQEILNDIVPVDSDHNYDWNGTKIQEQYAWAQLGKVAVRQGWVQMTKAIYSNYMTKFKNAESKDDLVYSIAFPGSTEDDVKNSIYPPLPTF